MNIKQFLTVAFVYFTFVSVFAQTTYKTVENIAYKTGKNLTEYEKERCKLDIYYPENLEAVPTIIWFHGGGLEFGHKEIPSELKEKGAIIVGVNYRLSPKVKTPAFIEDAAAATAWVFKHISEYNGDPKKIVLSGHSAGGYLDMMVVMDKSYLATYDIDANDIAALIPFSGHTITHFTTRKEQGIAGTQPIIDKYAPLFHVRKDAPPILLITGGREVEMLGRYEENAYFYRMMKVAGHEDIQIKELQGLNHGEMVKPAFTLLINYMKSIDLLPKK
ncbi:Acetyl esterase/lipase [Pustulibacterium marinum]|uniref:Acetyl esterase/lipase n=1 Tax=Pustulibacterium marinum TaxID=1224947 RepID=A0A1I7EU24_9FLAO|nr:alpha/beta hydrolase [Pustulibacterium marinum]SFU27436.1 Acetyl esterase/lipase [Pustulibacterium marinum]